jgi:drug/metabolite transporter (DMT)-like permease
MTTATDSARRVHPALPPLAAAATGILVGTAIVASRYVIDQTAPASLALLRYAIGSLCLGPIVLLGHRVRFARRDLLPIALLGIAQFGILVALLNFGLKFIPSARAALIFATFPLLTLLLGAALRVEALTAFKAAGVLLTILGVGFALGEKALEHGAAGWTGEIAVIASALTGAVCSVLYRPYLRRYPALPVSAFAMLASVVFLAGLAGFEDFYAAPPAFTPLGWVAVLFIGVNSGVGYYLWLWALAHTTPTRVSAFLSLSPITATGAGAWLLGEPVTVPFLLGLAAVAAGLWLAHREPASAA